MRQVVGKATRDLDAAAFGDLRERHPGGLVLDVGTGDGRHVLAVARARPDTLVVGMDAAPDAMRRTAASAARRPERGGVPNALFVWAAAEALPPGLDGVTEVHVLMPWGSLLRALTVGEQSVLLGVGERCGSAAMFLVTMNLHAWRPPVPEVGDTPEPTPGSARDVLGAAYARAGWRLTDAGYLETGEIAELATSWTKRLGASRDELAVLALRGTIS